MEAFVHARSPRIVFGNGSFAQLPELLSLSGRTALIVTGARSHLVDGRWGRLVRSLEVRDVTSLHASISGEPSPDAVDAIVAANRERPVDVVVGWGGGSVVDGAKAVSAMLPVGGTVARFLEGVGSGPDHEGRKLPFVAVPSTAGTGSEATKNAVLSKVGAGGYKKSLRHDAFVPDLAVVDPELALSCPPGVTAACGLDALTQLLEAFVSTRATPMTDALALSGLHRAARSLLRVCEDGSDVEARADMAYAALMSGIALANAGLGVVHGLASPLGGFFDIPHGVVCGTLLGAATRRTVRHLEPGSEGHRRYAEAGRVLSGQADAIDDEAVEILVELLDVWVEQLGVHRLSHYGVSDADFDRVVASAGNKNNAAALEPFEIRGILEDRL